MLNVHSTKTVPGYSGSRPPFHGPENWNAPIRDVAPSRMPALHRGEQRLCRAAIMFEGANQASWVEGKPIDDFSHSQWWIFDIEQHVLR
eukprot:2056636-Rhodomonas_salina.2